MKRFLMPSEYRAADSWRLLEWCREMGADEFTVTYTSVDAVSVGKVWADFDSVARGFYRGKKNRERMSGKTVDDLHRESELWELNEKTIDALRRGMPGGLLAYDPQQDAWFEDPVFYRDAQLMLGVLSQEAFAILNITEVECNLLDAAGLPSHESLPRISDEISRRL